MSILFGSFFHRISYLLDSIELDILELTADFPDPADIHGLNNVSGFRVDRYRSARAFPCGSPGRSNEAFPVGVSTGLPQRFVNKMHAVKPADGKRIGAAAVGLVEGRDEGFVQRRVVAAVVIRHRN